MSLLRESKKEIIIEPERQAFKVVQYISGTNIYQSAVVKGKARVIYKIGKFTQAPKFLSKRGYYLTTFNSIYTAKKFLDNLVLVSGLEQIFICDVAGEHYPEIELPKRLSAIDLEEGKLNKIYKFWPEGTEMWEYVRLVYPIRTFDDWLHVFGEPSEKLIEEARGLLS